MKGKQKPSNKFFPNLGTPLVRRVFPELIANEIVKVQPMKSHIHSIFDLEYIRSWFNAEEVF